MIKKISAAVVALACCCAVFATDVKMLQVKTAQAVEDVAKLKDGLRTVTGVKKVSVSKDTGVIKVKFDADKVSKDKVVSALSKLGCKVTEAKVTDVAPKTDGATGASVQAAPRKK